MNVSPKTITVSPPWTVTGAAARDTGFVAQTRDKTERLMAVATATTHAIRPRRALSAYLALFKGSDAKLRSIRAPRSRVKNCMEVSRSQRAGRQAPPGRTLGTLQVWSWQP